VQSGAGLSRTHTRHQSLCSKPTIDGLKSLRRTSRVILCNLCVISAEALCFGVHPGVCEAGNGSAEHRGDYGGGCDVRDHRGVARVHAGARVYPPLTTHSVRPRFRVAPRLILFSSIGHTWLVSRLSASSAISRICLASSLSALRCPPPPSRR
jgi:hypothetical protein